MLLSVKDVEEVLNIIEKNFPVENKKTEKVGLLNSLGRVISADVVAPVDIPPFNRSVVDGYAVKSSDTFGASEAMPAILNNLGEIRIGQKPMSEIKEGECMYVPTGGMLPLGSDSVVMIEDSEEFDSDSIAVYRPVSPLENIMKRGEDIKNGQVVIKKNEVMKPRHVGVLSSIGLEEVEVIRKPRVSIISTGDELVEPGKELESGQIWDINTYSLAASVIKDGGHPVLEGIVRDERDLLKKKVGEAVKNSDMILISGGSSAGFRDYTAEIINDLGTPGVMVHGISIKPGKPTIIGKVHNKPVIGMPGQPVSSLVVYKVIVSPLIRKLTGYSLMQKNNVKAFCGENYASAPGREEYFMVELNEKEDIIYALPVHGKSGMITTISSAKGMVKIPRNKEGIYRGEEVEVILL